MTDLVCESLETIEFGIASRHISEQWVVHPLYLPQFTMCSFIDINSEVQIFV